MPPNIKGQVYNCKIKLFHDFSMKFSRFSPEYDVCVVNDIFTKSEVEMTLKNIK